MSLVTDRAGGNGARSRPAGRLRLEPPAPGRRRRTPELLVGVLLVVGWILATVLLVTAGRDRTPVLALAGDVARGQVIREADLSTVYVGSDSSIAHLTEGEADEVVGRAALTDLGAGTVLTPELVAAPAEVLESGDATVGLSLEAGQVPSLRMAPGDRVSVVAAGIAAGETRLGEVVSTGEVVSVEETTDESVGGERRWWVAIRTSEDEAAGLAEAVAAEARVQLVLVGR
jgi:SAF domain